MRILACVLCCGAAAMVSGAAEAHWEYTRWGMTPEQVARASGGAVHVLPPAQQRRIEAANLQAGAQGTYTEGAMRLRVGFSFRITSGGLACVTYATESPAQNEALKAALTSRHGPPQEISRLQAIGLETLSWTREDDISLNITEGENAFVLHCAGKGEKD